MLETSSTPLESSPARPTLRPPRALATCLARPHLLAAVAAGLDAQVAAISAPDGFGKTELLRGAFLALDGQAGSRGWLTIAPVHRDRARFVDDLAAALGVGTAPSLGHVLAAVEARGSRACLFLDNVDAVENRLLQDDLVALFRSLPENLRLAVSGRSLGFLPLARLKARGLVVTIGPDQLAFSRVEIRRLVQRLGSRADPDAVTDLTRGWPAMVQLAATRRANGGGPLPRDLSDYVEQVVLHGLAPDLSDMLASAVVLDDIPPDLAVHLGDGAGTAADFEDDAIRPILEPSLDHTGWYRLHPAVRQHLEARLAQRGPEAARALHLEAAAWFRARGHLQKAVSHAARGGDWDFASAAIQGAGGVNLFIRAGHTVLERLVNDLPADVIRRSPRLSLCHVLVLAKSGRLAAARALHDELVNGDARRVGEDDRIPAAMLEHIGQLLDVYQDARWDPDRIRAMERRAHLLPETDTWQRGWLFNHLCIYHAREGNLEAAHRSALLALECYREERTAYTQIFMLLHLGLVNTLIGNHAAALEFSRGAQDLLQAAQWSDESLSAIAAIPLAEALYHQGEIGQAERMMNEAVGPLTDREGWVDIYSRAVAVLARARLRLFGIDAAVSATDLAEQVSLRRSLPRLRAAVDILRVELFTHAGMLETAEQLAGRLSPLLDATSAPDWVTWREINDFLLARGRLRLAQQRPAEALADLSAALHRAERGGSGYHRLRGMILAARGEWAAGLEEQALHSLQTAVGLARPHDVVQFFADEGAPFVDCMRGLLRRFGLHAFTADAVRFISRIVGHRVVFDNKTRRTRRPAKLDALFSVREREVLQGLDAGLTNKEIARTLNISEPTVKFHLRNIFQKLGVGRRSLAVSAYRSLSPPTAR